MMLEWSFDGKRTRQSAKTRSWEKAEQKARALMQDAHARAIGQPVKCSEAFTLDAAVGMFTAKKSGKHKETKRKYTTTLTRLTEWAVKNGKHYVADITESDLEKYQASWTSLKSNYAKRNEQERLRAFFRYCCASAEIKLPHNPTSQLEHFNTTSQEPEDPFTAKEYAAIVAAVDRVESFDGKTAERMKALIAVMRYAGLAIQDAAILERDAITPGKVGKKPCYFVSIRRSKSHTGVNNAIPKEVGDALLTVANGNKKYVFWSGNGEAVTVAKDFSHKLKKVFDKSGVSNAHSHRFRKTYGVDLLTHGIPLNMVSKALGHRNTVITERHYLKWVPKLQEQLAAEIAKTW
jgi:site-specific recombinase XerD